jgi:cell division protein FtsB
MWSVRSRASNGRVRAGGQAVAVLLALLCMTAYFAHHAAYGTHGQRTAARLVDRKAAVERETTRLMAIREHLVRDVAALSSDPPGPDITEEVARDVLGFGRPGEVRLSND